MPSGSPEREVVSVRAQLLANEPAGAYRRLVLQAGEIARLARPGHFVAAGVGGATSGLLLRRSFSIHRVDVEAGLVEIVVAAHGPGTVWLTELAPGAHVDLVGPLGRPFPLPTEPVGCVLVGGGYGSAPLFWLAQALRERGCRVEIVLGAAGAPRLFGVELTADSCEAVTVTTDDGSAGVRGWVSDVLPSVIERVGAGVVYACGPMPMLRSVSELSERAGAVAQVAVEEAMACGVGVCMTCVLPVVGRDERTRMVRSCVEGPVFRGDRVRWDAVVDGGCRVPDDAVGAPVPAGAAGAGGH